MSSLARGALVLGLALAISNLGSGQVAAPTESGAANDVVNELRLLRQAVERQSMITARAQLLTTRLSMQFMRASSAHGQVESLEVQLFSVEQERDQVDAVARDAQRAVEQAPEQERATLERVSQRANEQYAAVQQRLTGIEGRLARARESVVAEEAQYSQLDRLLAQLDREIQATR